MSRACFNNTISPKDCKTAVYPKIKIRQALEKDANILHKFVVESTKGLTKISADNLKSDFIKKTQRNVARLDYETNVPPIRVLVAEDEMGNVVGYLMFYYYYTPWVGLSAFVADVFVEQSHRNLGIGRRLLSELENICKTESLQGIVTNVDKNRFEEERRREILATLNKLNFTCYRTDEKDWSVFRFYL